MVPLSHWRGAPTALVHLFVVFLLPVWLLLFTARSILVSHQQYLCTHMISVGNVHNVTNDWESQYWGHGIRTFIDFERCTSGSEENRICANQVANYLDRNQSPRLYGLYRAFAPNSLSTSLPAKVLLFPSFVLCVALVVIALTTFFRTCSLRTSFGDIKYLQVTLQIKQNKRWIQTVNTMQCLFPCGALFLWFGAEQGSMLDLEKNIDFANVFFFTFVTAFAAVHALATTDTTIPQWYKFFGHPALAEAAGKTVDNIVFVRGFAGMAQGNVVFTHRVMKALMSAMATGTVKGSELAVLLNEENPEATKKVLVELSRLEASAARASATPAAEPLLA